LPNTPTPTGYPILHFASQEDWAAWLEEQGASSPGVWLQIYKAASGTASVSYAEALDVALCYGWIDSHKKSLDESSWIQKFTPRRAKSIWSKVNCEKAESFIRDGKMRPSGLAEVERARADGRWAAAYESQSKASVPDDLQAELDRNPEAAAFFATLNSVNRYAILFRIQTAKKPETRARRISEFVGMLARHEKIHP
jgi:uncharacterized protein YdeI (YjbR/CyaY-like superfamily)